VQKAEDLLDARFHFFETPILTPTGFLQVVVKSRTTFELGYTKYCEFTRYGDGEVAQRQTNPYYDYNFTGFV